MPAASRGNAGKGGSRQNIFWEKWLLMGACPRASALSVAGFGLEVARAGAARGGEPG